MEGTPSTVSVPEGGEQLAAPGSSRVFQSRERDVPVLGWALGDVAAIDLERVRRDVELSTPWVEDGLELLQGDRRFSIATQDTKIRSPIKVRVEDRRVRGTGLGDLQCALEGLDVRSHLLGLVLRGRAPGLDTADLPLDLVHVVREPLRVVGEELLEERHRFGLEDLLHGQVHRRLEVLLDCGDQGLEVLADTFAFLRGSFSSVTSTISIIVARHVALEYELTFAWISRLP